MKKILSAAAAITAASVLSVTAFADVFVTISDDKGELVVPHYGVAPEDVDGDGAVTVNDILIIAHDKYYDGGAEAGYTAEEGDYGLMITKLWGIENGGSYGYYVNNVGAMSLADPIKDGDHVNAFAYTDTTAWSDVYSFFETDELTVKAEAGVSPTGTVTLYSVQFDENWSPVTVPVEGATITLNGSKTDAVTDADGKAVVTFPPRDGNYVLSAVSDTMTLVPAVCIADVKLASESAAAAGDVDAATSGAKGSPNTGIADVAVISGIAVLAAGAVIVSKKRK